MSGLDDELERAAAATEPVVAPIPAPTEPTPDKPRGKRSPGLLIGLLVMGGGIRALVFTSFQNSSVYS